MPNNWAIIGHQWAVDLLQKHLAHDHLRHAYLFTGPDGIGRRTLALRFAQAINHPERIYDPGNTHSQQFARMEHPDLSVAQRLEGDRDLKIEAIRELQRTLSFSPYMADYRIALLLDFEQASEGASNALLKTLEEPASRVVLILTAESAEALLPTIVSRCEVLRLRPVGLEELGAGLQSQLGIESGQARLLAHLSNGKPGYALHLAENPEILDQRTALLDDLYRMLAASKVERFEFANQFYQNKPELISALNVWLTYWRDILLQTTRSRAPLTNLDRSEEIHKIAQQIDISTAHQATLAIENKLKDLGTNIEPRLAAEALLLEIPIIQPI